MISVEGSIQVDRPQEEVWAYSSDPARLAEWCGSVQEVHLASNGSPSVGTEMVLVEKFMGRDLDNEARIVAWEPPRHFGYQATSRSLEYEVMQTTEARDNGTQVTVRIQAKPEGFFKVAQGMVKRELGKQIEADLSRLKTVLEG